MKIKYCSSCKAETAHYKEMCIRCGTKSFPPGLEEFFRMKK